jgi:hypothetical protein
MKVDSVNKLFEETNFKRISISESYEIIKVENDDLLVTKGLLEVDACQSKDAIELLQMKVNSVDKLFEETILETISIKNENQIINDLNEVLLVKKGLSEVGIYICMYICICMCVYIYTHIHVYINIYLFIYIYMYIYITKIYI